MALGYNEHAVRAASQHVPAGPMRLSREIKKMNIDLSAMARLMA